MKYDEIKSADKNIGLFFILTGVICLGIISFCFLQFYFSLSVPLTDVVENNYLFQPYQPPQTPFYKYILLFLSINIVLPLLLFLLPFFFYGYKYHKNNTDFNLRYKKANDFRIFFQTVFIIVYIVMHLLILYNGVSTVFLLFINIFRLLFIKVSPVLCVLFYNTGAILSKYILLCKK